jgi:N-methylhydantoinase A
LRGLRSRQGLLAKAATTPSNPAEGFFNALENAAGGVGLNPREFLNRTRILVNATTTATNAIVTKRGARLGLLTTAGHGQSLFIMNGAGRSKGLAVDELLYMPASQKPRHLVARDYIEEITERVDCKGDVVVKLDERQAREAIERLVARGIDALAICLLWSFQRPDHELALKRLAARINPDLFISCSCEVSPFLGEHGRTVATLFNAYVGPLMGQYIEGINRRAREGGLGSDVMFARCVGGCVPPAEVAAAPLYTIDSGPVSGVQGSSVLGPKMGYENIITTDMGGTTFDVGIVYRGVQMTRNETVLDRFEMRLPMSTWSRLAPVAVASPISIRPATR